MTAGRLALQHWLAAGRRLISAPDVVSSTKPLGLWLVFLTACQDRRAAGARFAGACQRAPSPVPRTLGRWQSSAPGAGAGAPARKQPQRFPRRRGAARRRETAPTE